MLKIDFRANSQRNNLRAFMVQDHLKGPKLESLIFNFKLSQPGFATIGVVL